jgi:hypothetical protein
LLLVQRAEEEHDRRLHCIGYRFLFSQTTGQAGFGLPHAPSQQLALTQSRIGRTVQIQPAYGLPSDSLLLKQPQQGCLGPDMQQVVQFFHEIAALGSLDEGLSGGQQSALAGEPDGMERPQAIRIEARGFVQVVIAPSMGVAGSIGELLQLTKDRHVDFGPQRLL